MSPTLVLAALAVLLTLGTPVLLPRLQGLRSTPAAGLLLWQGSALGGLSAIVLLPLVAAHEFGGLFSADRTPHPWMVWVAGALSMLLLARLLFAAHTVGTDLRALRRRHREAVDLLDPVHGEGDRLRVIDSPSPVAWCLPGRRARIVMSRATLEGLAPDELHGVYLHERAHLRRRHDLVVEFLTVVDAAAPRRLRHPRALAEVGLMVELLADRAAAREVGAATMGRALAQLGTGSLPGSTGAPAALRVPAGSLGVAAAPGLDGAERPQRLQAVLARVTALQQVGRPHRMQAAAVGGTGVALALAPSAVAVSSLLGSGGLIPGV